MACSDKVCPLLLTLLDPREHCTPVQVLATKIFVRLVHVLHASVEEVRKSYTKMKWVRETGRQRYRESG